MEIEQGTEEWFAARRGKATASRIIDITAKTKSGWGASRKNYAAQLVAERLTGATAESFTNAAMQWGIDNEARARGGYEFKTDNAVVEVGFVDHPTIAMSGASPDGLVDPKGLVEIKCPATATHIDTLLGSVLPIKYICQMQWQMACCVQEWCDFVSFDPRLPAELQLFVQRIERDDKYIAELETTVTTFLAEVDETVAKLREYWIVAGLPPG